MVRSVLAYLTGTVFYLNNLSGSRSSFRRKSEFNVTVGMFNCYVTTRPLRNNSTTKAQENRLTVHVKKNITDIRDKEEVDRRVEIRINELKQNGTSFTKVNVIKEVKEAFRKEKWGTPAQANHGSQPPKIASTNFAQSTPKQTLARSTEKIAEEKSSEEDSNEDEEVPRWRRL